MTPSLLNFDAMLALARSNPFEFDRLAAHLRLEAVASFGSLELGEKSLLELELMLSRANCPEERLGVLSEMLIKTVSQLPFLIAHLSQNSYDSAIDSSSPTN
jgi:hypothetical protein